MIIRSNSERDAIKAIGDAITGIVSGINIALGVESHTPFPSGNTVSIAVLGQERQSTNEVYYPDTNGTTTDEADRIDLVFVTLEVQLDCYGSDAFETANTLLFAFRSDLILNNGLTSLYSSEPLNLPYLNARSEQVDRWTMKLKVQFNTEYRQKQESALAIELTTFTSTETII